MKRLWTVLLAVLFFTTACGGEKTPTGEADSSASAQSGEESTASGDTIPIAFIGNTTGDYQQYGIPVRNAVKLYFDQLNAQGGIEGKKVELLEFDDKGDGIEAINAYNLASEKGATAVIGSVLTGPTIALADVTFEDNMPEITPSATADGVTVIDPEAETKEVRTNVFRSCFTDPYQGQKMAMYAKEKLGAKSVGVFYETGNDYSEGVMHAFVETAKQQGLTIVAEEAFGTGDKDFRAQMTKLASEKPDAIFLPIYYSEAGLAITAARTAGYEGQFLGADGLGSVKDYAEAGDLEGTLYCSGYAPGTEAVKDFEESYQKSYGEAVPNMFAPLAWDASLLLTEGIKAAEQQGLEVGSDEYKQAIIDTISNIKDFKGITGTYAFDDLNNPIKDAAIIELKGGEEVFKEMY